MREPDRAPDDRPAVLVNAGGSESGGGRTYVLAVTDELRRGGDRGMRWEFLVQSDLAEVLEARGPGPVRLRRQRISSPLLRILWEQITLPRRWSSTDGCVLVSAANFGPLARRRGHVLLARNALYFSEVDVSGLRGLRLRIETALARASVKRATVTVTATETMARLVKPSTTRPVVAIMFGPGCVARRAPGETGRFTFVHRTLWGPHKRFADILRAVGELAATHAGRFVVHSACDPGSPFARTFAESRPERELLRDPTIASHVEIATFAAPDQTELRGDAVVMPSVTESFCFPLAEAIGVGLPVVAARSEFARELCGDAAFYVPPGDAPALAVAMRRLIEGERPPPPAPELVERLSWRAHVDRLAEVCRWAAADGSSRSATFSA
jgi:glycosyltransferase involved in cell wall biosynthesis